LADLSIENVISMTPRRTRYAAFIILGLLAILGTILVLRATPEGLGLSGDSIAYIAGARSILAGHGYSGAWLISDEPVTHYPPGFPAVLALVGLAGIDPLRGARLVNALLFGINAALLGILFWRMTKSLPGGLVLAALFVANGSLLQVHAVAMSEPLFIFFSLLAFWMFDLYFERDDHWLWLVLCGVFVGFAYLTRYAGLALIATFVLALMLLYRDWRNRLASTGIFIISVIPWIMGWAIRNELVAGSATNRVFVWHPLTAGNFDTALSNISMLLMPVGSWQKSLISIPIIFEAAVVIILGSILIWIFRRAWNFLRSDQQPPHSSALAFAMALYIFGYLASIIASMLLFDASTKFKLRILSPVYVSLLFLLVALGFWLWNRRRGLAVLLAVVILGMSAYGQVETMTELMKGGQGFASFIWYRSKAMEYLRGLPPGVNIYTDQPGVVYLYTGRGVYTLPNRFDPVTAQVRPGFELGAQRLQTEIRAGRGVLALFSGGDTSAADAALLSSGLPLVFKSGNAEIYAAVH
jgi:4-amino-4-deoxy-L-arabinose transferase-like glycosyltransferase